MRCFSCPMACLQRPVPSPQGPFTNGPAVYVYQLHKGTADPYRLMRIRLTFLRLRVFLRRATVKVAPAGGGAFSDFG